LDPVNNTLCEYGVNQLNIMINGTSEFFTDGGTERRTIQIHRVVLNNLLPNQQYKYHVGSLEWGWSPLFFFTSMNTDSNWSPRVK
jgi:hypothetical protein